VGGVAVLGPWHYVAKRGLPEVHRLAKGVLICVLLCILELGFSDTRGNIDNVAIFYLYVILVLGIFI
jgi:hypothetical protein